MWRASNHDSLSTFAAENESRFEDTHDREPSCMPEHVAWNCSLAHLQKFANDRSATIHRVLFGGVNSHQRERQYCGSAIYFFHWIHLLRPCASRRMYAVATAFGRSMFTPGQSLGGDGAEGR